MTKQTSGRESPEEIYQNTDEDGEEDEEEEPEPSPMEGEHPLLFCYQTQQQRKLLLKYGNDTCIMEVTYKMTRYALPLFFFCVRTNVSYQVVGTFVIQYSTIEAISEALQIFHQWNPSWEPRYFMTDFAEEEIQAIENVFKGRITVNLILIYSAEKQLPLLYTDTSILSINPHPDLSLPL